MPGNHDAVRLMEPQLPLPDRVIKNFKDNLTFTANPVLLDTSGVKILCYHGKSLDGRVHQFQLTYEIFPSLAVEKRLCPLAGHLANSFSESTNEFWMKLSPP